MFLIRLISRLPLSILYGISDFLFFISYRIIRYRRRLVWRNLKNSFPEKTVQELKIIEREFYRNLCDYAVETLKLVTISKEELRERMVFKNPELAIGHFSKGQSVLFLASHQFNWEWLLVQGSAVYAVPMDFVYQSVNSRFFDRVSNETRTRLGAHAIRREEVARETIRRKDILRGIAVVADQYPGLGRDKKYSTTFLNQETVFFYGTNQLAHMTQYPVIFYTMKKTKRGYYETTAVQIATPPYSKDSHYVIEAYVRAVEKVIQENPSGWLWSHNRWKKRHLQQ